MLPRLEPQQLVHIGLGSFDPRTENCFKSEVWSDEEMRIRNQSADATEAVDCSRGLVEKHDHLWWKIEAPRQWIREEGVVAGRRPTDQAAFL